MSAEPAWGVDSEHGRLLDVLVCRPDNYRWRATSAISEATLEAGYEFDAELAASQHAALVSAYEDAGVRCHYLDTDPAPAVPGVHARLEHDGAERHRRHAAGSVVAPR